MRALSLRKHVFYGMGGLTISLSDLIVMQWLLVRYVPPGGKHLVDATLFGVLVLLGRIVEGIGFTVVAHWSDQCRSKIGRRIPFMRAVIVPFALVFFLMFNPPVDHLHWANMVYAAVLILLYFGMYGAVVVPYVALIPELTPDLKERVDLTTWQSIFVLVSTLLFGVTGLLVKQFGWAPVIGTAGCLGVLFFLPACLSFRGTPPSEEELHTQDRLTFRESVLLSLQNRPFVFTLLSMGVFWFALSGLTALVPYWVVNYLGRGEDDVAKVMLPYLVVSFVSFIAINKLVPRFGKRAMMLAGYLGAAVLFASLSLVGTQPVVNDFLLTQAIVALCGVPVALFTVLAFPVLADVVDYDEQLTGRRREAIFYGVKGVFQKVLIGASVLTFTLVSRSHDTGLPSPQGLKLMALTCGAASLGAFLIFLGYPLRERNGVITNTETPVRARRSFLRRGRIAETVPVREVELTATK